MKMCCAECSARPLFTTKVTHKSLKVRASGVDVELRGGGVEEALRDGDRVRVRALRSGEPVRGQIVLKVAGGRWVLHRLLRATERRVKTRGDNRSSADAPSERVGVVGVATHVLRGRLELPIEWPEALTEVWLRAALLLALARERAGRWRRRVDRARGRTRGGTAA
jgi:hypothetical protein